MINGGLQTTLSAIVLVSLSLLSCRDSKQEENSMMLQKEVLLTSNRAMISEFIHIQESVYKVGTLQNVSRDHYKSFDKLITLTTEFNTLVDSLSSSYLMNENSWRLIKSYIRSINNTISDLPDVDSLVEFVNVDDSRFLSYQNTLADMQESKNKLGYELILENIKARVLNSVFNVWQYYLVENSDQYFSDTTVVIVEPLPEQSGLGETAFSLKMGRIGKISSVWLCDYDSLTSSPIGPIDSSSVVISKDRWAYLSIKQPPIGTHKIRGLIRVKRPDNSFENYPFYHSYQVY